MSSCDFPNLLKVFAGEPGIVLESPDKRHEDS
jgi:hypothetical protein